MQPTTDPAPAKRFQVAELRALLTDPARAGMLLALIDGTVRPAGELARMAGVAPPAASGHLKRLLEAGLLRVVDQGRHRYYMRADARVAHLIETLALARRAPAHRPGPRPGKAVTRARTCYEHLAGRLGVALFESLRDAGAWTLTEDAVYLSPRGAKRMRKVGLLKPDAAHPDLPGRACVDWTERRFHLGGALGAWLTRRVFETAWLRRRRTIRALSVTDLGRDGLRGLGVSWDALA